MLPMPTVRVAVRYVKRDADLGLTEKKRNNMETKIIKQALEIVDYKYFGDYELTSREREAVNTLIELAESILKKREAEKDADDE